MTVDEIRLFVNFLAKKNQSGANPGPIDFNLALQRAYVEWVMSKYGNDNEYTLGREIPRISWQKTQKNTDDLRFLLVTKMFSVPSTGKFIIPNGTSVKDVSNTIVPKYMHLSSIRSMYVKLCDGEYQQLETNVDIVRDNEVGSKLGSNIVNPTKKYPMASIQDTFIQFYPKNIGFVTMSYLKQPTLPVWGYTGGVTTPPVYDSTTSVQLESPEETHNDIVVRILRYLGISIREPQLIQYSQAMKMEGI